LLPLIKINLTECCQITEDIVILGKHNIAVQTYAFNFDEFLEGLKKNNENADVHLSKTILQGLMQKPLKSKILFFFSPNSQFNFISAALLKLQSNLHWLSNIYGYVESAQEYLKPNARPFMYWDGNNLHRIYDITNYDPSSNYINDFGSIYGLASSETEEEMYKHIKANTDNQSWDYSIVPKEHEEIVTIKEKKFVLLHNRYELSK